MRVVAILTIDGSKETRIEGDSPFMADEPGDELERKGLGVWLNDWCDNPAKGKKKAPQEQGLRALVVMPLH